MKILIVANSKTREGRFTPFVTEQIKALQSEGIEIDTFGITGKGILGYLTSAHSLRKKIKASRPDLIHAHYGLSGLSANLQRIVPVITTYHGSDIHSMGRVLALSRLAIRLSVHNIFVSQELFQISGAPPSKSSVIPCGIDLNTIQSIPRDEARHRLNRHSPFVLFSGSFQKQVKNPALARQAMSRFPSLELVELSGYTRQQVNLLMNAADCLLMTSHREGSPQVVKEAMACGTPVVSVDVGDVKDLIRGTQGCYLTSYNPDDIAHKIRLAMAFKRKTNGRQRILELGLDNHLLAKRIVSIYQNVLNTK